MSVVLKFCPTCKRHHMTRANAGRAQHVTCHVCRSVDKRRREIADFVPIQRTLFFKMIHNGVSRSIALSEARKFRGVRP